MPKRVEHAVSPAGGPRDSAAVPCAYPDPIPGAERRGSAATEPAAPATPAEDCGQLRQLQDVFESCCGAPQGGAQGTAAPRGQFAQLLRTTQPASATEKTSHGTLLRHDYADLANWVDPSCVATDTGAGAAGAPVIAHPGAVTWEEVCAAFFFFGKAEPRANCPTFQRVTVGGRSKSLPNRQRTLSQVRGNYPRGLLHSSSILERILHSYDTVPLQQRERSYTTTWVDDAEETEKLRLLGGPPLLVDDSGEELSAAQQLWAKVFGIAALSCGLLAMSCIGSVASAFAFPADGQPPVNGMLLGCWIAQALHLIFLLISFWLVLRQTPEERGALQWLVTRKGAGITALAGVFSGIGSGCWTISFGQTTVPQAYLFNAFPPSIIMLFRCMSGLPTFCGERGGVLVGIFGAMLCLLGSEQAAWAPNPILGDSLAFISSVSNAICVMSGKYAAGEVPTVVYLAGVTFYSAFVQLAFCLAMLGPDGLWGADPVTGIFGWASERWRTLFLYLATAFTVGQWGMFAALKVVPALGVSMVLTAQPIVATIMGVAVLKTEAQWPAPLAIAGGLLIVVGSLMVVHSSSKHEITDEEFEDESDEDAQCAPGPYCDE